MIHLQDYFSYLIVQHFEYMMHNVVIDSKKIQYTKACCPVFTTNTNFHGSKAYLKIQLIPQRVPVRLFVCDLMEI